MATKELKLRWKRDDGSGMETDDLTLWINGEPSEIVISGGLDGEYGTLYYGNKEIAIADTRAELREIAVRDHKDLILKEASKF